MKLVICGDTHIGAVYGLGQTKPDGGNTRIDDYEKTLNNIVDYCIDNSVDLFVQTGDAFDSRNPSPEHMSVFNSALRRLSKAGIASAVIMGNHDYRRSGNTFTSAISELAGKHYPNVRIVLEPQVLEIKKGEDLSQVILLPYRDRKMYEGNSTEEDSLLYEEEVKSLIDSCDDNHSIVAIGHNFFKERGYNDYGGLEVLIDFDAFEKCDLVVMGHYHEFKVLRKVKPVAIYSGSMEKLNFGDEKVEKFFIEFETEKKKIKIVKSPVRQLVNGNTDLSMYDEEHFWKALKDEFSKIDFKDKIVRYHIAIQGKVMTAIKKADIKNMIYEEGAYFVSKVTLEPIFNRMVKDSLVLKHKDDLSRTEAFIASQPYDDKLKEKLINEARLIIGKNDATTS